MQFIKRYPRLLVMQRAERYLGAMKNSSTPWLASESGSAPKKHAPATARNREPIKEVLREVLPASGLVLELASGSGEHIVYFAGEFPALRFQPSDPDPEARLSIAAWTESEKRSNVLAPLMIDAASADWPITSADALLCINMVHISPWESTLGLLAGASRILPPSGLLYLYGPYRREGVPTAESNEAFDRSLRQRNPAWGLRSLEDLQAAAAEQQLQFERLIEMPANNLSLLFRRLAR